ncbi:MAG: 23S rRNA (pseudouridine(1915)-N(3))-methyltransferase RlmH [Candidatus Omnitrophica bacterium]|nr:23S rRNA (pseudouridine(1915)-N(3))-methyltransferase RlmH [Candidatus Omnitrophota bacterium]
MEVEFSLSWIKSGVQSRKAFKSGEAYLLFHEYLVRITKFVPCKVVGRTTKGGQASSGIKIWVCDRGSGAKALSSEELAKALERAQNSGTRKLRIAIGGSDGFREGEIDELKPDLRWSFGPITLPHELATVVAGEQIYRAFSILHHLPYHSGH